MKSLMALTVLAMLPLFLVVNREGPPAEPAKGEDSGESVVVLQDGDWRKDVATECLQEMLMSDWEGGRANLRRVLDAAGFELTRITLGPGKQGPGRIRFGFQFENRDQLKTVYWEADCRVDRPETEEKLAAR